MLKSLELSGFKSFAKKSELEFSAPITSIVGPNGSGKSNIAESIRFVLGEQSLKSLRGKKGEDMIFNGSKAIPAMNRAHVSITFDNSKRMFSLEGELSGDINLNFDEIIITREVYRDGTNKYLINGSQVRLRDIIELLASVNIGASGHHIISQGEADRILNANIIERRTMIEEALGLKIYQWKISDGEKKLERTRENTEKAESLRREIAPHIKFLKKQVEKVEKAEELRVELSSLYAEYLKREEFYLTREKEKIGKEKSALTNTLRDVERMIGSIKDSLASRERNLETLSSLRRFEEGLRAIRRDKDELSRKLGRLEGRIEIEEERKKEAEANAQEEEGAQIPVSKVRSFAERVNSLLAEGETINDILAIKSLFVSLKQLTNDFLAILRENIPQRVIFSEEDFARLRSECVAVEEDIFKKEGEENSLNLEYMKAKSELEKDKDLSHEHERKLYELSAHRSECVSKLDILSSKEHSVLRDEEMMKTEIEEAKVLIGNDAMRYQTFEIDESSLMSESREIQEDRRKKMERMKIRLEDMGAAGGAELMREYQEVSERDTFLEREIGDLKRSAEDIEALITNLRDKLNNQFSEGIEKINKQFDEFFKLMFDGGSATLSIIEEKRKQKSIGFDPDTGEELYDESSEDEDIKYGIDIKVNLPQKKIRDLQMLSGGERALTSIALIFAVSQVNPPPFLVLDETDAALDEANSRKYADMLENLAKHSQLVVITHNRETMSRAGVLYGITTAGDAASRLLSVKFEEAVAVAK
ncbi:MAG: Chromosome partition protein smc [Parcubacteria group bacterium LiPW_30]|nr:MAG: Chromosome partition protein smc [Parcubacteria group bacterium LiPW_30]